MSLKVAYMEKPRNPVEYLPNDEMLKEVMSLENEPDGPKKREDFGVWGYKGPGWYFWDESWAWAHGPHKTREEANKACERYCAEELGPPTR